MDDNDVQYDVVVVGGGAAGLSGALLLARARYRVLVLDDGTPRNAPADGVHNWLTRDGLPPAEIGRIGRAEVTGYGGVVRDARVTGARTGSGVVVVTSGDGTEYRARRLLVTTGLTDEIPPVDGLTERWGSDVFGCPFCHAWEHRDTRIGVLSTGPHDLMKVHIARRWSDDVTLFLHTGPEPDDEQWAGYATAGVTVVDGEVAGTVVSDGRLTGLRLGSGTVVPVDALTISPRAVARAGFLAGLGLEPVEHPSGLGAAVPAGPDGSTSVPGIYAAGNVVDPMATVPAAVAAGSVAAAGIARDLIMSDLATATGTAADARAAADPFSAASEAECATRVAGDRVHGLDVPVR
ncbi:NAD(P)/FAD-dependent oxidoreductase [Pseudonocardia endophytica]|uniref:Thioredoxin reductase n=1 Tax=Pseudonocardia endophytica TaxID=401976 RepID=A0A4R1HSE5_PSEEN|nr:FAD-dependent oxidoreductase [Pseudonocardia endophytica]TCK24241.1 thioredoxin reductase [Pseudonocardia endophytica]